VSFWTIQTRVADAFGEVLVARSEGPPHESSAWHQTSCEILRQGPSTTKPDLTIAERLAATDPHQHRMATRPIRQPRTARGPRSRDRAAEDEHFQAALTIAEWLTATNPTNAQWRQDLDDCARV
jgi:hypothetical protein